MSKPLAEWKKCTGEAHTNPYIDNCMMCMPYWGDVPLCPNCKEEDEYLGTKRTKLVHSGHCKTCKKYYDMQQGGGR